MSNLKRRHFLQGTAAALGAIGLNQLTLTHRATHYGRALAQSTPRKVALLVGVNDYSGTTSLNGSLNDIQLQRQLLIHRFGFNNDDVHLLPNANRQTILDAYQDYLLGPAQNGDVIVFHYSGHGDRIQERDRMTGLLQRLGRRQIDPQQQYNTAIVPQGFDAAGDGTVADILGHTLLLMRAALVQKTPNVTFVLDCCYAGGGKRGNVVMRSLTDDSSEEPTNPITGDEAEYQQVLLQTLGWDEARFADEILSDQGQGLFIGAARPYQQAADYQFDGFTAGAFTYLLTQYLWQDTGPITQIIPAVASSSTRLAEHTQAPEYDPQPEAVAAVRQTPIYHVEPVFQPAEALVLPPDAVTGNKSGTLPLWLGGVDPLTLEAFDQGVEFAVVEKQTGQPVGRIEQVNGSRRGLVAQGRITQGGPVDPENHLLQERIRGIPESITLNIGLDDTLTEAEQQTAIATLNSPHYRVFPVRTGPVAHVLLGRYTEAIDQQMARRQLAPYYRPTLGSIGLLSPAQEPILTGAFAPPNASIEQALERLTSRFTSLHLGRMLALMVNQQTASLKVTVTAEHQGSRSKTGTRGGSSSIVIPQQSERGIELVPLDHQVDVTIANNEAEPLHFGLLVVDGMGDVDVLFPPTGDEPDIDVISGGGDRTMTLTASEPLGITELLVLASPQSLRRSLNQLRRQPDRRGDSDDQRAAMNTLFNTVGDNPGDPLGDKRHKSNHATGTTLLNVETVAMLSLLFEILPADAAA